MIDYRKIILDCIKEEKNPIEVQAKQEQGAENLGTIFCVSYFERQAKKFAQSDFIDPIEFYVKCYSELVESINYFKTNEQKFLYTEKIYPILETALNKLINNDTTDDTPKIIIPDNILIELQAQGFIENKNARPLKWLKNKQFLRELLTHSIIKGTLSIAEIERQTPLYFVDKNDKSISLAKNKKFKGETTPPDKMKLDKIIATL